MARDYQRAEWDYSDASHDDLAELLKDRGVPGKVRAQILSSWDLDHANAKILLNSRP